MKIKDYESLFILIFGNISLLSLILMNPHGSYVMYFYCILTIINMRYKDGAKSIFKYIDIVIIGMYVAAMIVMSAQFF